jgi:hypothetical protein
MRLSKEKLPYVTLAKICLWDTELKRKIFLTFKEKKGLAFEKKDEG